MDLGVPNNVVACLRELIKDVRQRTFYRSVRLEDDYYEFDLGQFGTVSTSVSLEDDEYQFDAEEVFDEFAITTSDLETLADELETFTQELSEKPEPTAEPDLGSVLARLESDNGPLVKAIRAIIEAMGVPAVMMSSTAVRLDYDPKTVAVDEVAGGNVSPQELRLGDEITGYGRVLGVTFNEGASTYTYKLFGSFGGDPIKEYEVTDKRDGWYINPIAVPIGRLNVPTAFELTKSGYIVDLSLTTPGIEYDPLTVAVDTGNEVPFATEELRLGDDITGSQFGRVLSVTKQDGDTYRIVMDRDGKENVALASLQEAWYVFPVNGVDRSLQPTALSLSGGAPSSEDTVSVDYDPLTVELKTTSTVIEAKELRLGEDIIGGTFGRVTKIENDVITMRRDAITNTTAYNPNQTWSVLLLARSDRDSVPTAASLTPVAV